MTHLTYEELSALAEAAAGGEGFEEEQIRQLEHLKDCQDCYETFCLLSALSDTLSESGSYLLPPENAGSVAAQTKVLAVMQLIRDRAADAIHMVMEQIDQAGAALQFGAPLAMAARGGSTAEGDGIRLEEFEDEKTCIVFRPQKGELYVQLNLRFVPEDNLRVRVLFADQSSMEVPLTRKGNLLKGTLSDLPAENFRVSIEADA